MKNQQDSIKLVWHYPHLKFWNGGTKFILDVGGEIVKEGHDVILITNLGEDEITKKFREGDIRVVETSFISTNSYFYWLFFPLTVLHDFVTTLFAIKKINKGHEIKLMATLFPSNLIMSLVSKFKKIPYYYYCYEPFPFLHNKRFIESFSPPQKWFMNILSFLYGSADKWATKYAKKIFTLNTITKKMIKDTYEERAIITYMGVDTDHFKHYKNNPIRDNNQEHANIIHSTDYSYTKRTDLAIKIFSKVNKAIPNSRLWITSTRPDSPRRKIYVNLAKRLGLLDEIEFLDLVPYEKLPLYYDAADCYISCSYDEMMGTTSSNLPVKEALACQTPAVRAPITNEDVEDGVHGYLADPRDLILYSKRALQILNSSKRSKKMGKNGRKKIVQLYNWKRVSNKIIQHLEISHDKAD